MAKGFADGISVYRLPTPDDVLEEAPKLKEQYDLVIADGPAGLSEVTRAILLRADVALLQCGNGHKMKLSALHIQA